MIGLDTNVLVRYLVQDDAEQAKAATDLIDGLSEREPGYICREVIVELVWVLERAYKLSRAKIVPAIEGLISSSEVIVEDGDRACLALAGYAQGGSGFSDRMILAAATDAGCDSLATFDKALASENRTELLS